MTENPVEPMNMAAVNKKSHKGKPIEPPPPPPPPGTRPLGGFKQIHRDDHGIKYVERTIVNVPDNTTITVTSKE